MNADNTTGIDNINARGKLPTVVEYRGALKSITSFVERHEEAIAACNADHDNAIQKATQKCDSDINMARKTRDDGIREATTRRDNGIREAASRREAYIRTATSRRDDDLRVNTRLKNLLPQAARVALQGRLRKLERQEEALERKSRNSVSAGDRSKAGCGWGALLGFLLGFGGCVLSITSGQGGGNTLFEGFLTTVIGGPLFVGVIGLILGGISALVRNASVERNNAERDQIKKEIPGLKNEIVAQGVIVSENKGLRNRLGLNPNDFDVSTETISQAFAENEQLILKEFEKKISAIKHRYDDEIESFGSVRELGEKQRTIMNRYGEIENDALCEFENSKATEMERYNEKLARLRNQYDAEWSDNMSTFDNMVSTIFQGQPMLTVGGSSFLSAFPEAISAGAINVRVPSENCETLTPNWLPFPVPKALFIDNSERSKLFDTFLLRLLVSLPEGGLHLTVCDPVKMGHSFGIFSMLHEAGNALMTGGKVLTSKEEVEAGIQKEFDILGERMQKQLHDGTSWADYNKAHPGTPLEYRLLIIYDVPELLGKEELRQLARLVELGPKNGILPIIDLLDKWDNRDFGAWLSENKKHFKEANAWLYETVEAGGYAAGSQYLQPDLPSDAFIKAMLQKVIAEYKKAEGRTQPLPALWSGGGGVVMWSQSSLKGLEIPLGWDRGGKQAVLRIGGASPHTLLAGKTGSGKSNLLHVLINSLAHRYSPGEARVFLLDFKQGVEMAVYARHSLPHAALVAVESDVEYGVSVLRHLEAEIKRRNDVFKRHSINDYSELGTVPDEERFPRWLLVVDEFQVLFSDHKSAMATEKTLEMLLKQGRSVGLHILLATQTLKGLEGTGIGALSTQMANRVCLACGPDDSQRILGNPAGAELKSPPEAIINDQFGAPLANVVLRVPFAEKGISGEHLDELRARADGDAVNNVAPKVFRGDMLPSLPVDADFTRETVETKTPKLWLGHELNYDATAFFCKLNRKPGANLLCVGGSGEEGAVLRKGLLAAVARSISSGPCEVLYLSFRADEEMADLGALCGENVKVMDLSLATPEELVAALVTPEVKREVPQYLIIDGLDYARVFRSEGFKAPPAAVALAKYIADGPAKSCWTVAFGDDWRRVKDGYRDLLREFGLRAGFCMDDGNAGAFFGDAVTGLGKPNRAFFKDDLRLESTWFRPFIEGGV